MTTRTKLLLVVYLAVSGALLLRFLTRPDPGPPNPGLSPAFLEALGEASQVTLFRGTGSFPVSYEDALATLPARTLDKPELARLIEAVEASVAEAPTVDLLVATIYADYELYAWHREGSLNLTIGALPESVGSTQGRVYFGQKGHDERGGYAATSRSWVPELEAIFEGRE